MTAREWKPGDVALIAVNSGVEYVAIRSDAGGGWSGTWVTGRHSLPFRDSQVTARPLVVIDPEDREQVERLADGVTQSVSDRDTNPAITSALQSVLREFANPTPPKPEEPTGLGAVVEDAEGVRWVRVTDHAAPWRNDTPSFRAYADIDAVRELSEGWSE